MKDSWLYSSKDVKNQTYISLSLYSTDTGHLVNDFFSMYFLVGENIQTTQRTVYNLIDTLSNTGGLASVIMLITTIITSKIQKILYY